MILYRSPFPCAANGAAALPQREDLMRIVGFWRDQELRLGFQIGDQILDPSLADADLRPNERGVFRDAISFIESGERGRRMYERLILPPKAEALRPLNSVKLGPPLRPTTILCAGSNYAEHNAEKAGAPLSGKEPEFFLKTADSVIGDGDSIQYDGEPTKKLDCETELAVIIGKPGRHITREKALEHVFGYTIANDVTARDRQVRQRDGFTWYELGRGKAFDTSAPIGPAIVSADEIPDPQALFLRTRINGELRQSSDTSKMIWSCADLIHFFSVNFTLKPGFVLFTGTPAGTAWSVDRELGGKWTPAPSLVPATRYCLPGDQIESEIQAIGTLRNRVAQAST